ncbi:hypothetical protein Q5P01_024979 [Channa striata]|uniref:Uncharacterized protein n=1 Tax=Channa striata TaxID=64152 RepID=A0AA88LQI4_CHASR|nr:hypothetical protein Q5P01_024979 [Channa striata]
MPNCLAQLAERIAEVATPRQDRARLAPRHRWAKSAFLPPLSGPPRRTQKADDRPIRPRPALAPLRLLPVNAELPQVLGRRRGRGSLYYHELQPIETFRLGHPGMTENLFHAGPLAGFCLKHRKIRSLQVSESPVLNRSRLGRFRLFSSEGTLRGTMLYSSMPSTTPRAVGREQASAADPLGARCFGAENSPARRRRWDAPSRSMSFSPI